VYAAALGRAQLQPVRAVLEAAAERRPASYEGWVLNALQNAFYQLLHAESLAEGVIDSVAGGADTDTNAAIAGALLGAVYGRKALPAQWLDRVLSCRPLSEFGPRPRPEEYWPVDALYLAEALLLA
jgi:ADP-ribosylglycohydrolase